jgi:hypothetical protein
VIQFRQHMLWVEQASTSRRCDEWSSKRRENQYFMRLSIPGKSTGEVYIGAEKAGIGRVKEDISSSRSEWQQQFLGLNSDLGTTQDLDTKLLQGLPLSRQSHLQCIIFRSQHRQVVAECCPWHVCPQARNRPHSSRAVFEQLYVATMTG